MVIGTLHFSIIIYFWIFGLLIFFANDLTVYVYSYVLMVVRVLNGYAGERFIAVQFFCV